MAHEMRRGPGRPKRDELSEQQRRVLDLLVAGKTNGEIGEALGISLDGAKYHVSAICDLVGVATREEAAEWWRQQRGFAARFAVSRGWSRLPALVRLAIGGAAGVAAAAGVIAALVLLSEPEEGVPAVGEGRVEPGLWVAAAMQDAPAEQQNAPVDMRLVVHGPDGDWKDLGETRWVRYIALAPDTRKLAIVEWWSEPDETQFRSQLVLVDSESGEPRVVDPEPGAGFGRIIGWSPDSQILAVEAARGDPRDRALWTELLSPDGNEVGRIAEAGGTGETFATPAVWSPDSRMLLLDGGDSLVVATVTGEIVSRGSYATIQALAPHAIGWQPTSELRSGLAAYAWTGADTFTATLGVQDEDSGDLEPVLLAGRITGGAIAWEPSTGGDVDAVIASMPAGSSGPYPEWVAAAAAFGWFRSWSEGWHGSGLKSALVSHDEEGPREGVMAADMQLSLFVEHDGEYSIIDMDMPREHFDNRIGVTLRGPQVRWDAVVVR